MIKFVQCHYIKPHTHEQCSAESVINDPDDGVLLCQRHLAAAMAMVAERKRTADVFTQRLVAAEKRGAVK